MPTRFLDKHRRAKRASRRLHLAFWLGALVSYLCYLIIIVPLFIFMAALFITPNASGPDAGLNNLMMLVLFGVAVIAVFLPVFKLLKAYNGRKRELGQQSAGEQAEALGGSPARPDDDPLENRYVNLVAELSLAAGIPAPAAYVLRDDDSINAFALSGAGDSLALAVSRGALDNLTRDELQAVLGHEFGHIENGDPALYNRLSAMLAGYFATGSRKEQERLYLHRPRYPGSQPERPQRQRRKRPIRYQHQHPLPLWPPPASRLCPPARSHGGRPRRAIHP